MRKKLQRPQAPPTPINPHQSREGENSWGEACSTLLITQVQRQASKPHLRTQHLHEPNVPCYHSNEPRTVQIQLSPSCTICRGSKIVMMEQKAGKRDSLVNWVGALGRLKDAKACSPKPRFVWIGPTYSWQDRLLETARVLEGRCTASCDLVAFNVLAYLGIQALLQMMCSLVS